MHCTILAIALFTLLGLGALYFLHYTTIRDGCISSPCVTKNLLNICSLSHSGVKIWTTCRLLRGCCFARLSCLLRHSLRLDNVDYHEHLYHCANWNC